MARIEPEIRVQWRRTPIRPIVPADVRLVVPSAEIGRVHDAVLRRTIHHVAEGAVGIKDQHVRIGMSALERVGVLF